MQDISDNSQISAEPTKAFFIEMLTRDIPLEQAVLDLVDNSVDAAKSFQIEGNRSFQGRIVKVEFDKSKFRIIDNCGGFNREIAKNYAFRFGRPENSPRIPHSIGQFGVGMKRALFKFGDYFTIRSATTEDSWAVEVNVPAWEKQEHWLFPWGAFIPDENVSNKNPGTEIVVTVLRPTIAARVSTNLFENTIIRLIKSKHRQFIAGGLSISVNGQHIDATSLSLLVASDGRLQPGTEEFIYQEEGKQDVKVRIIVGVGSSSPREAGWYVVCNGRVILEHDRSSETGWGLIEEQSNNLLIPSFHNQFARFRGIIYFDSNDSSRVPWNTTKTHVDQDSPVWQKTFGRMTEMMRPVISFLNELDTDIDEYTREKSPLLEYVNRATPVAAEALSPKKFAAPPRETVNKGPKTVKVQYSKPVDQVNFLMEELSVTSASAVGQRTFELIYQRMGGE